MRKLSEPSYKLPEEKSLIFIDGFRVLTMVWALLSLSAVYILTVNCRDIYSLVVYLNSYAFTLLESGLMTPDLFMFFIYFLSFVYISRIYQMKGRITIREYLLIYFKRFFKLIPMYYLVFFFTWFVYPILSENPGWFVTERFAK